MLEGSLEEEEERWLVELDRQECSPRLKFLCRSRTSALWWRFIRSSCSSAVIRPRGCRPSPDEN